MFGRNKKPKKPEKTETSKDGLNTFVTFETTDHAEAGCPKGCDGDHVRVGVHGLRPDLDSIPYDKWTTPEVLATSAAEHIAQKLTITKATPKGLEH